MYITINHIATMMGEEWSVVIYDKNIYDICAVLAEWDSSVVRTILMKMGGYFWLGTYIHNNQLHWY